MPKLTKIHRAIVAAERKWVAAYNGRKAPALAGRYTKGGQILPPNSDAEINKKKAIETLVQNFRKDGLTEIKLETLEAEGVCSLAYEVGLYTLFNRTGDVDDYGKYVVVW